MMRFSLFSCASLVGLCASVVPAAATVVISNAATQNMTCYGATTCAPTAVDAVLNVQDLETMLASGNTSVTTTGSGVQATNIRVNAKLSWSAATTLTLDAFRSIEVNSKVAVAGTGGVSLTTNDGGTGGDFVCDNASITFANLSSKLTINGAPYTLVNSVASLASAIAANPSGAYALAKGYNAKKDGTFTTSPIATVFSGSFNGLGNTISNLSIDDPAVDNYVGFFAETTDGSIANARLVDENVQGGSGSSIGNSKEFIGGLIGYATGGAIVNSFTSGTVSGGVYASAGGLLGLGGTAVTAASSAATVYVTGLGQAGGLIGGSNGSIANSHATGNVSGVGFVGGLVGFYYGTSLKDGWASGAVSSTDSSTWVGGLAGINQSGIIERSHASGNVTCVFACGGLVGFEGGGGMPNVSQSFATGAVSASGNACAGGLVGLNQSGEISNSYASGNVSAEQAGGLACQNINDGGYHAIARSYSTGVVTGQSGSTGGLLGGDEFTSTLKHTYWDMTTSGITDPSQGAGNVANDLGIKGLSDAKLKSGLPKGFSSRIWSENSNINGGLPYLINNPPPK